ncbi:hypothetical protein PROFUN_08930 [Planoprotostelium fungivorum]|uniref:Uncharacterized protein n=1 Tax=Planoprotostelium fungivorum TaxID=1890364 RepID=A0A2P6NIN5_9EUKA|nr:hypothetical protein PROFUN_08930 [Planoprotostelium fungivorum]
MSALISPSNTCYEPYFPLCAGEPVSTLESKISDVNQSLNFKRTQIQLFL